VAPKTQDWVNCIYSMVFMIQLIHTVFTVLVFVCIFNVIYSRVIGRATSLLKYSIALVLIEWLVVGLNGFVSPVNG